MTPSLLTPPEERRSLWRDDPPAEPPPPAPPAPPTGRHFRRRRVPLVALLATTAVLGGGVGAGAVAALQNDGTTTVAATVPVKRTTSGGLDASSVYASAAPGVVDIAVNNGSGTGFVVDKDGHIVTAAHVVNGANSITVKFQDGTTRKASVLGRDEATDVAVIKIDPSGLTLHPLPLGSSASVGVGDDVAAIGDPFGYARSISTGIVSGVDRTIKAPNGFTVAHAIQTDAAMNPGNSGGPVLDADGQVVGIADQIATDGSADQSAGVGFAVPIDLVKSALTTLKSGGTVEHAYVGVATGDSATNGATLSSVASGGPAEQAGLRAGDVVTAIGGTAIGDSTGLVAAIASHQPGDEVKFTVKRGSQTLHPTVTLGTQPAQTTPTPQR